MIFQSLFKFLGHQDAPLKIGTFGLLNNPNYREEPWRENIKSRLDFFDSVCLVCGHEPDLEMLAKAFPTEWQSGKLKAVYKQWPFPEWSYDEIPQHFNLALSLAKDQGCDWAVRLDVDTVFHEKDNKKFRAFIHRAHRKGMWLASFGKLQFFSPLRFWKKGNVPIGMNLSAPLAFGFDQDRYTDLAQPIEWDGSSRVVLNGKTFDIPSGKTVQSKKILKTRRLSVYNYDYTFRTYDRSVELVYQIEMAHARFFGKGYSGLVLDKISRDTAIADFIQTSVIRYKCMNKTMAISDHPRHFQDSLRCLRSDQWGVSLWGRII